MASSLNNIHCKPNLTYQEPPTFKFLSISIKSPQHEVAQFKDLCPIMLSKKYFPLYGPQSITPYSNIVVSDENYKAFYTLDRLLFCKLLVLNLDNPAFDEAVCSEVIGFWLLLEREGFAKDLIHDMLQFPNTLVASLIDEAIIILNCLRGEQFGRFCAIEIPFTSGLTIHGIKLPTFFQNRVIIRERFEKIVNRVCPRVFNDLSKQVALAYYNQMVKNGALDSLPTAPGLEFQGPDQSSLGNSGPTGPPRGEFHGSSSQNPMDFTFDLPGSSQNSTDDFTLDFTSFLSFMGDYGGEVGDGYNSPTSSSSTMAGGKAAKNEPSTDQSTGNPDNRTIFLTFSKGYPLSQNEIVEFFTGSYGADCIEALRMQEVEQGTQPLYARLIVKSRRKMGMILENRGKVKFSINGKHVWARKYVPKYTSAASLST